MKQLSRNLDKSLDLLEIAAGELREGGEYSRSQLADRIDQHLATCGIISCPPSREFLERLKTSLAFEAAHAACDCEVVE